MSSHSALSDTKPVIVDDSVFSHESKKDALERATTELFFIVMLHIKD